MIYDLCDGVIPWVGFGLGFVFRQRTKGSGSVGLGFDHVGMLAPP